MPSCSAMRRIHRSDLITQGCSPATEGRAIEPNQSTHADNGCRSGLLLTQNGHQLRCGVSVDFCDRAVWLRQDDRLASIRMFAYGFIEGGFDPANGTS